jgi:selenophosphate synthetase-related protein
MKELTSVRDIVLFELDDGGILVSAVDSCGGIGMEPNDALKINPAIAGKFTARVAVLEIMAVGATPCFASLAVSSGQQTAEPLIAGVKEELGENLPLVISTEKNMPTSMTGLGVTVTGICPRGGLLTGRAKVGDKLYCAGTPLVGEDILKSSIKLFDIDYLKLLIQNPHVHSLIPVGSKGIAAEAAVLAGESGLKLRLSKSSGVDLYKSAGPSTCAVFAADFSLDLPVYEIGELY